MAQSKEEEWERRALDFVGRRWKTITLLVWLGLCAWFIADKWHDIRWFGLGDTDDNMRIMQVRAWLHGQGWYDLRQHRLNPPVGANIHWSRLVDLPIAGLILGCGRSSAARARSAGRSRLRRCCRTCCCCFRWR